MAKVGTIVLSVLIITLVFAMFGSMLNDFTTADPTVDINSSAYIGYDYTTEINESTTGISEAFQTMSDSENWLTFALGGITAIPKAIFNTITLVIKTIGYLNTMVVDSLVSVFKVPRAIVYIFQVILFVVIIFSIVEFWRKSPA